MCYIMGSLRRSYEKAKRTTISLSPYHSVRSVMRSSAGMGLHKSVYDCDVDLAADLNLDITLAP